MYFYLYVLVFELKHSQQCYLLSEPGAEEAVDDKVGRGVDDEEDVGDEAQEDDPDGETSKDSATTDLDLLMQEWIIRWNIVVLGDHLENGEFVEVEQNPEEVAEHKGDHNHHQHHLQTKRTLDSDLNKITDR